MSHRPADWHILDLDQDPTPGDPQRVRKLAGSLHDFADDVSHVLRDIKGMANEDAVLKWAGKTAESFTAEFEDVPGKLKKLKKSYDIAGDALASYWPDLENAQEKADQALRDGRKAHAELSTAQTALTGAKDWVRTATAKADSYDPDKNRGKDVPKPDEDEVRRATRNATHAKEKQTAAQKDVDDAQGALNAAKMLAAQAKGLREDAARRTVKKLHEASDAGIHNRHWWEEAVDWVTDHWDEIVTVCKWVVTIVGIIVMIVGGPLGWLVFAAALVVLADTIRKMLNGQAGWGDLVWALLDCIPATKGFTSLAKMGKLWKAGGLKALGAGALKGITGGLRGYIKGLREGGMSLVTAVRGLASRGNPPLNLNIRSFPKGRPGLKIFRPGDRLGYRFDHVPSTGKFDVAVHGAPGSVGVQVRGGEAVAHDPKSWANLNHRELADLMRQNGWNGEDIRLLSCQTGMRPDGFAQDLANKLGVSVEAPTDFLWVHRGGKMEVGPFDPDYFKELKAHEQGLTSRPPLPRIHPTERGDFKVFEPNNGS